MEASEYTTRELFSLNSPQGLDGKTTMPTVIGPSLSYRTLSVISSSNSPSFSTANSAWLLMRMCLLAKDDLWHPKVILRNGNTGTATERIALGNKLEHPLIPLDVNCHLVIVSDRIRRGAACGFECFKKWIQLQDHGESTSSRFPTTGRARTPYFAEEYGSTQNLPHQLLRRYGPAFAAAMFLPGRAEACGDPLALLFAIASSHHLDEAFALLERQSVDHLNQIGKARRCCGHNGFLRNMLYRHIASTSFL
jgi:hypothetical protein